MVGMKAEKLPSLRKLSLAVSKSQVSLACSLNWLKVWHYSSGKFSFSTSCKRGGIKL